MPALKLHDTLSRTDREVKPLDGKTLRFYCCGPTVYGPAHIGNFRTFVAQDVMRRVVEASERYLDVTRMQLDRFAPPVMRKAQADALAALGTRLVLTGHDHAYARTRPVRAGAPVAALLENLKALMIAVGFR